jgi:hypothetical protein
LNPKGIRNKAVKAVYLLRSGYSDLAKDLASLAAGGHEVHGIWVNGLAKSGTSLVENIVSESGYVDGARSILRRRYRAVGREDGLIDRSFFCLFPKYLRTYHKTHSLYYAQLDQLIGSIRPVIVLRDIRDALVSRYHHVMSDPTHWDYRRLLAVEEKDRFFASITAQNPVYGISQIEYYARWVDSWLESSWQDNIVWFEDYCNDELSFTAKVLDLCNIDSINSQKITKSVHDRREKILKSGNDLARRRHLFGAESGTLRKGKAGEYREYFNEDSYSIYFDLIEKYRVTRDAS